jgi:hypothetical protein
MKNQSDTKRPRSVKAEFDQDFDATANGGGVLVERTLRNLGVRRFVKKYLATRNDAALYAMEDVVGALMSALLVGGRGIGAIEFMRQDPLLSEIFGLHAGAPSGPTTYRVLCELAGLQERKREECYEAPGPALAALDMLGRERKEPRLRRVVPETPEAATPERRGELDRFTSKFAVKCANAIPRVRMRLHDWFVVFGDATDLEVDGRCFDAARLGRLGKKILRWQTLMLGPVIVAQQLHEGNVDEGRSMPRLFEQARQVVRKVAGARRRVLALLDAAYFERQVIDPLSGDLGWDFIVCANQQRDVLERLAEERPGRSWSESGADAGRGWSRSQVCCFTHKPEDWASPVTIVARRWQKADEIDGAWHYAFIATRIEPEAMPKRLSMTYGYCEALWMLYSTKQGHENHYKTSLRDLGLHHPPSCRLGIDQAFYAIATAAANAAMVLRWRVVAQTERGITLWRLREVYFRIAGKVRRGARRLEVILAGGNVAAKRQVLWDRAFAEAGRL